MHWLRPHILLAVTISLYAPGMAQTAPDSLTVSGLTLFLDPASGRVTGVDLAGARSLSHRHEGGFFIADFAAGSDPELAQGTLTGARDRLSGRLVARKTAIEVDVDFQARRDCLGATATIRDLTDRDRAIVAGFRVPLDVSHGKWRWFDDLRAGAADVPSLYAELMDALEPSGQSVLLTERFAGLAERLPADEWATALMEHHRRVQRGKPPNGKAPWCERFDDGCYMVRPAYRVDERPQSTEEYVHAYRTGSLQQFAIDLGMVSHAVP